MSLTASSTSASAIDLHQIHDVLTLREMIVSLHQRVISSDQTIASLHQQVDQSEQHNRQLKLELERLRRQQYGRSAERFNPDQLKMFEECAAADIAAIELQLAVLEAQKQAEHSALAQPKACQPRQKPVRKALPEHLPRVDVIKPAACTCKHCGGNRLHERGEEISEKLCLRPAELFVERTIQKIMSCRDCEKQLYPATPAEIIDRGIPGPSLLADLLIQKYVDHLPLYRLSQIYGRAGLEIPISTLAEWVGKCGVALQPLCNRLRTLMQEQAAIHVDETPVLMLNPAQKTVRGNCKQAYLFAYRSAEHGCAPIVLFDFQSSRAGKHAQAFLADYRGALVVDDYAGYKRLFEETEVRPANAEIACLAHARRKFFDLQAANQSTLAAEALTRIQAIYAIERDAKEMAPEVRLAYRSEHSLPKINALFEWLKTERKRVNPNTGSAKAMDYCLKREGSFRTYLIDGRYPIDNNAVENAIRPIAIGRKNWLFAGSEPAGIRAAAIMSLLATAKANGLAPMAYMTDVLSNLPTTKDKDIDSLLPMAYVTKQKPAPENNEIQPQ